MRLRHWRARARTGRLQLAFGIAGCIAATFFVLEADFSVRLAVLFVGLQLGAGLGTLAAAVTRR